MVTQRNEKTWVAGPLSTINLENGDYSLKAIFTALLSTGLLVVLVSTINADNNRNQHRRYYGYYYSTPSTATERQLRNERAYERGEYYEHDSNALPLGSRAWREQKRREGR
jgi:hypothetical protein